MNDIIIKYAEKEYEQPTVGMHQLQVDDIKLVEVDDTYNGRGKITKVRFRFMCRDQKDAGGYPVSLVRTFTQSLHEKSALREFLVNVLHIDVQQGSWLLDGKTSTPVAVNKLIGAVFQGYVKLAVKDDGKKWAEIADGTQGTLRIPTADQQAAFIAKRDALYADLQAKRETAGIRRAEQISAQIATEKRQAAQKAAPTAIAPKVVAPAEIPSFEDDLDAPMPDEQYAPVSEDISF